MEFKKLDLQSLKLFSDFFESQPYKICDYSAGAVYMWREFFDSQYAIFDDTLVFKFIGMTDKLSFSYPILLGEQREDRVLAAIAKLREYATKEPAAEGGRLTIANVPEEGMALLRKHFSETDIQVSCDRDWSDYLYSYQEIHDLAGRKFSSKRNHIKNFDRSCLNHSFEKITTDNIGEVREFFAERMASEREVLSAQGQSMSELQETEENKTKEVLDQFFDLPFDGAVLKAGSRVAAFTVGEKVGDVLFIHIEKANIEYKGVYTKLFHEFVLMNEGRGINYLNREEDVGDEGLRKSKLSYNPIKLLDKHVVTFL